MQVNYEIGSDPMTVKIAARLIENIKVCIDASDFQRAERMIEQGCRAANIPLRMEFVAQCEAMKP